MTETTEGENKLFRLGLNSPVCFNFLIELTLLGGVTTHAAAPIN